MRIDDVKSIKVSYRGRDVGTLRIYDGYTIFQYTREWIKDGFSISPLKLPLREGIFRSQQGFFGYLDGAFYDCLPDSWGNMLVDKWLVQNGYDPRYMSLFHRLTLLNETSLGGLDFKPCKDIGTKAIADFDSLLENCWALEKNEPLEEVAFSDLLRYSGSVGGSRPKVFVKIDDEDWILKFPSIRDPRWQSEMEYDYNVAAVACGIKVPPFQLVTTRKGVKLFATKRFDRENGNKIHVISLAGLTETNMAYPQLDYLSFLQCVLRICPSDLDQAVRLMVFNIKAQNRDDHSRNISFLWSEETRRYTLSPAYDLTYTPNIREHALSCNWIGNPTDEDIVAVGKKIGLKEEYLRGIISTIEKLVKPLEKYWGVK